MSSPTCPRDFKCLADEVTESKNRFSNRSGYSPHQRVFGSTWRMPAALTSDDPTDPHLLSTDASSDFERATEIRSCAQQALLKLTSTRVIQSAQEARSRTQPGSPMPLGSTVFIWRSSPLRRSHLSRWVGPGILVMNSPTGNSCWIHLRGTLYKCSREQVRLSTNQESLGAEVVNRILTDSEHDLRLQGQ